MTFRLYSQQLPSQKMAENKLYDICVRGRCGIWLGFAILVIIVMATSLSKDGQTGNSDEQTGNSDKQTAGIGIQTGNNLTTTHTPAANKYVRGFTKFQHFLNLLGPFISVS